MNLSVVILTKNEEENINNCIRGVSFADEIIVVDDESSDLTPKIAKKLGAKVVNRALKDDWASQRNFGMSLASCEWILFLDADERVNFRLKNEILLGVESSDFVGYKIPRIDFLWGDFIKYGEVGNTKLLRLIKKGSGKWQRKVHEEFSISGLVGTLKNPLHHFPHPNLKEFLSDVNRYSSLHALENKRAGKKSSLFKITVFPLGKFFVNFVLRFGFLDGMRGLVLSIVMSLHSYLAWSKLWYLEQKHT